MGPRGVGVEHRVIDNQLASSFEDVAERLRPVLALEGVLLFDELPGQIAPLPTQLVTHPSELLLLRQVLLACLEPLVVFHHLVSCHLIPSSSARRGENAASFSLAGSVDHASASAPGPAGPQSPQRAPVGTSRRSRRPRRCPWRR